MRYAIIAAGEGSRLAAEGIPESKPLVRIQGAPLVDRLLRIFMSCNAADIVVVCNEQMKDVQAHLLSIQRDGLDGRKIPLRIKIMTTPSSMHSLYALSEWLQGAPFCLTTVDTVFRENEFIDYVKTFEKMMDDGEEDGLMGVTSYIDDEKPLYVGVNDRYQVTGFYDEARDCSYISAGIYGLNDRSLKTLQTCVLRGERRMRNFQRALVADGMRLLAYPFSKVLDIDHAHDIEMAEQFLKA